MCNQEYVEHHEVKKINEKSFVQLEVVMDTECSINPREDYDNVGTMVCFHNRYELGDKDHGFSADNWKRELAMELDPTAEQRIEFWEYHPKAPESVIEERIEAICEKAINENCVIMPLYLYDHSGITMNTTGFHCPWDSGTVGFIYCTKERAIQEWGKTRFTKKVKERAEAYLKGEVEDYDNMLTGNVWGYRVKLMELDLGESFDELEESEYEDHAVEVEEDSCWGFLGDPEYCVKEGQSVLEHFVSNHS